ncbi:MAG: type II toxin-antitoxin system RelE/ParE family toxin [Rhodospirillales bacterium]|nr:type II toxin-antitoxin system RelE/ParE family toxin [Rhodospirillales bacterium]
MVNLPYSTRQLVWLGNTRETLSAFPTTAKKVLGFGLRQVQNGETPEFAVPLRGIGSGVYELKANSGKDTYRVVYIAKLSSQVFVLHAFMKKSKTERSIPNEVKQTIVARLKQAMQLAAERNE